MFWDCGDFGDFLAIFGKKHLDFWRMGRGTKDPPPLPEGGGVTPLDPLGSFLCS